MLVKTAGVKHMVVLVNKMDDPTVNWEEERFYYTYLSFNSIYSLTFECFTYSCGEAPLPK
jgi:peptide chain release factor subunit 3